MRLNLIGKLAAALGAGLIAVAGSACSTLNVADSATPLFDSSQIAPLEVRVAAADGGGVEVAVTSRGVALAAGVLVFSDGATEVAELSGVTAGLTSDNTSGLVCVMVQVQKGGDYWYFDNSKHDYWYFDSAGQMMTYEEGAQWYSMY